MDKEKDKEFLKKISEIFSDPEIYKYIDWGFPDFPEPEESSENVHFLFIDLQHIEEWKNCLVIDGKYWDSLSFLCKINDEPTERKFWEKYSESLINFKSPHGITWNKWNDFKPLMKIKRVSEVFDEKISKFSISYYGYLEILFLSYFRNKKRHTLDDDDINIYLKNFLVFDDFGNYDGDGLYKLLSKALTKDFEYPQVIDGMEKAFNKLMYELEKLPRGYYMLGRDVSFEADESKLKDFYNKYWCNEEFDSYEEFVQKFNEDPGSFNDAVEVCKRRLKYEMIRQRKRAEDIDYINRNNDVTNYFWDYFLPGIEKFDPSNLFDCKSLFDRVKTECSSYKYSLDDIVDICTHVYDEFSWLRFFDEDSFDLCDGINSFIIDNRKIIDPRSFVYYHLSLESQNDFTNIIQNNWYYKLYVKTHKNKKSKTNEGSMLDTNESGSKGRR